MTMKKAIVIPIYLKLTEAEELPRAEGIRLAKRAIESLKRLEDQNFTLILPVCFDVVKENDEVSFGEMDKIFRQAFHNFCKNKTFLFSSHHLKGLRKTLEQRGLKKLSSLTDLRGYSKIRNTGLILAQMLGMDVVVFIDNDEIIEDAIFLQIACEFLNEKMNGKLISGKGGFYINPDGTILLPSQHLWWRLFWDKTKWMNRAWEGILVSEERIVPSPMLLGGNLALHRDLFSHVPFDPYIPRGEDTDYLINASKLGFYLLFDKQLRVKHLHPERDGFYFLEELRGDIERFRYEREKIREGSGVNLYPYPGCFLKKTLYPKAILTSIFLGLDYLSKRKWKEAKDCVSNISLLFREPDGNWLKYQRFRSDWERMMEIIQQNGPSAILERCWI
jgi:hypothetical protein